MAYQLNKTYLLFSNSGSGKCLNVSGGTVANNRNVCILDKNDSAAQNWMVKAFGSNLKLVTGLNQSYALNYYWSAGQGNPGNCDVYPQSGNDADSSIVLEPVSTDVYRIKLKNYNLYLTAKGTGNNADVRWEAQVPLGSNYTLLAPQEWRFLDPSAKGIRAPFIYAGFWSDGAQYCYDDDQIRGLDNATEFVICSGVFQGYFTSEGKPASAETTTYIQLYVQAAVQMTRRLYTEYGKQVWIGTPTVGKNVPNEKTQFEEVGRRMTYFIDNLIAEFNKYGLSFDSLVKGIYMSDEEVLSELDSTKDPTSDPQIKMFQTTANYAAGKGKKMLWSPYVGTNNLKRAAIVIHKTNIFDYALIQPQYFATGYAPNMCQGLRTGIAIQRVTYENGTPILHESAITCTKTVIGCQMEINWKYNTSQVYKDRFDCYYEKVFNESYGAYSKGTANFGFYFGCPPVGTMENPNGAATTGYMVVKNIVNQFFDPTKSSV